MNQKSASQMASALIFNCYLFLVFNKLNCRSYREHRFKNPSNQILIQILQITANNLLVQLRVKRPQVWSVKR